MPEAKKGFYAMRGVWKHTGDRDGDTATATLGDFTIQVQDLDGDLAEYEIKNANGDQIASGRCAGYDDFEACKAAAWAAMTHIA
ncbi:hypothetical protein [Phaeobacter piscinae]|uniref:hypothetical protein n=1 Tax=Phaeobacter piscinae TaxID=1580596 RepID=UPI000C99B861|nr:hypothetical protein [Phaeobacter piscinae]AUQ74729.1 hypothetical protein PhaeoP71_01868 [Phaeobacter piscinae]